MCDLRVSTEENEKMIEVNLIGGKKVFKLPVFMGIDLNLINIKWIIVVYVLSLFRPVLEGQWVKNKEQMEKKLTDARNDLEKVKKEGSKLDGLKQEIEALDSQEKRLNEKLSVVKKIIKIKKNPMSILLFVAKNIPVDAWLKAIEIDNDQLTITGEALSYKSIAQFIESLKDSIFFEAASIKLVDTGTRNEDNSNKRLEFFKLKAVIVRYE